MCKTAELQTAAFKSTLQKKQVELQGLLSISDVISKKNKWINLPKADCM